MCNGFSTRTTLGGALAVLHPSPTAGLFTSCLLQFHNPADDLTQPTSLTYTLTTASSIPSDCEVRIHNLGDLTAGVDSAGRVLHTLPVKLLSAGGLALDRRLDLGVGGDGIIGRTVSMVREGVVIGEGIIGWN